MHAQHNTLTGDVVKVPKHVRVNRAYLCCAYLSCAGVGFIMEMLLKVWHCLHHDGAAVSKSILLYSFLGNLCWHFLTLVIPGTNAI
jgi:hypothetical protein